MAAPFLFNLIFFNLLGLALVLLILLLGILKQTHEVHRIHQKWHKAAVNSQLTHNLPGEWEK